MKTSLALPIAVLAMSCYSNSVLAGEVFDSPGRGYREQKQRVLGEAEHRNTGRIHLWQPGAALQSPGNLDLFFDPPFLLLKDPQRLGPGFPLKAPVPATPKK
jgi:hypothetical protein